MANFRFAVTGRGESLSEWQDFARKAEDLGYSTLAIGEHIDRFLAPFPALVSAAHVTRSIRLGTQILINDFRHPLVLAKEAATANILTDGRLELGLGLGSTSRDYEVMGLRQDSVGERIERLEETVKILKLYFSQEIVDFKGKFFQINGARSTRSPVQGPIPLMLGAANSRMLTLAAREANIISVLSDSSGGPVIWGPMDEKINVVRKGAGARLNECEIHTWYNTVQVDGKPAVQSLGSGRTVNPGLQGSLAQVVDKLIEDREKFGISYVTVGGATVDAFAPVVAKLVGT